MRAYDSRIWRPARLRMACDAKVEYGCVFFPDDTPGRPVADAAFVERERRISCYDGWYSPCEELCPKGDGTACAILQERDRSHRRQRRWQERVPLLLGLRFGGPLGLSGSVGWAPGRLDGGGSHSLESYRGPLAELELGTGGVQAGLGLASLSGLLGLGGGPSLAESPACVPVLSLSLRATVAYTWEAPFGPHATAGATYAGVDVGGTFLFLSLRAGAMWRIDGPRETSVTWALGLGM